MQHLSTAVAALPLLLHTADQHPLPPGCSLADCCLATKPITLYCCRPRANFDTISENGDSLRGGSLHSHQEEV